MVNSFLCKKMKLIVSSSSIFENRSDFIQRTVLEHEQILMNKEVLSAVFILNWICFSESSIIRRSTC